MKKIFASIVLFSLISVVASGQDVRFGFQCSPAFSWMATNNNKINPSGSNLGLKLGMLAEYFFRDNYAVSTGIGFAFNHGGTLQHEFGGTYWTRSGLAAPLDSLGDGVKLKYGIQYVEIPVALKMKTREFGYLRYFLEPGITIGFKSQGRGKLIGLTYDGKSIGEDGDKINIRREINGLNLSWGITGGLEYALTESTSLIGGIGFQIGFTDVTDDNGTTFDPNRDWPNRNPKENSKGVLRAFNIKLGVLF